jgi:hypothetical protein
MARRSRNKTCDMKWHPKEQALGDQVTHQDTSWLQNRHCQKLALNYFFLFLLCPSTPCSLMLEDILFSLNRAPPFSSCGPRTLSRLGSAALASTSHRTQEGWAKGYA